MPPSIAIVVLDNVRYDAFCDHFNWIPGMNFKRAYSVSHWTIPAHGSLFTGRFPREIGTHAKHFELDCPNPTIAEQLSKNGYRTSLFTANPHLLQWGGWRRGFDSVIGPHRFKQKDGLDWAQFIQRTESSGLSLYFKAIIECVRGDKPWFKSLKEGWKEYRDPGEWEIHHIRAALERQSNSNPEFAFINLMEAHTPYSVAESYMPKTRVTNTSTGAGFAGDVTNPAAVKKSYYAAVRTLSDRYESLFDYLSQRFDYVITLSDHGELLGENGLWGHGFGLQPEVIHIPFNIYGPRTPTNSESDNLVSLLDLHETVLTLANVDSSGRGINILGDSKREKALFERCGQPDLHKEIFKRHGIYEKFDEVDVPLRGVADRDSYIYEDIQGIHVLGQAKEENTKELLDESFNNIPTREVESDYDLPSGVKKQLRDLGYA